MSHQKFYFQYRKEVFSLWHGSEHWQFQPSGSRGSPWQVWCQPGLQSTTWSRKFFSAAVDLSFCVNLFYLYSLCVLCFLFMFTASVCDFCKPPEHYEQCVISSFLHLPSCLLPFCHIPSYFPWSSPGVHRLGFFRNHTLKALGIWWISHRY